MARYEATAKDMNVIVERLIEEAKLTPTQIVDLAHIINFTVRCSPRGVQGTVRKNIVQIGMGRHVAVTMEKVHDVERGTSYNKIGITPRG